MTSQEFGELIRIQRESKKLSIEDLATRFKLSPNTLRSIENGSLENLPHAVYARGFVRSYAHAVGVASEDLEAGIEALFPPHLFEDVPSPPSPLTAKPPRTGKSFGDKIVAAVIFLVVVGVPLGAGMFVYTTYGEAIGGAIKRTFSTTPSPAPVTPSVPVIPVQETGPDTSSRTEASSESGSSEPARSETQEASQAGGESSGDVDQQTATTGQGESSLTTVPETMTPPELIDGNHVRITALDECWVEVTADGGGTRRFTVYRGDAPVLLYRRSITIVLGNTGGVTITHNNKPYPLNGRKNEKRTLKFQ